MANTSLRALRAFTNHVRVPFGTYNLRPVTATTQPGTGVYRSAMLWGATRADLAELQQLGVRLVIDLRTAKVRANFPDPHLPGAVGVHVDIHGIEENLPVARETPQDVMAVMQQRYRNLVRLPSQRQKVAEVMRLIADEPGAVIFHCTDGKDRTGWIAVLLQHLHGDSMQTIWQYYLDSNRHVESMRDFRYRANQLTGGTRLAERKRPSDLVHPSYLRAALETVTADYGDLDGYLSDGLGLDEATLERLRAKL
ncbi:tyrosine-protein phosphatase [Luteococcus sanguinis]|uniref:Tyrosine-protein phosphatase n=1 Tax=Luteococcus sanguinis TaxID=174038 RepID=A0ABW1WYU8_9ACTN